MGCYCGPVPYAFLNRGHEDIETLKLPERDMDSLVTIPETSDDFESQAMPSDDF